MNRSQVEAKIHQYYRHFSEVAPGVRVQEAGDLAGYWALWERATRQEIRGMDLDEVVSEFGWIRAQEEGLVA